MATTLMTSLARLTVVEDDRSTTAPLDPGNPLSSRPAQASSDTGIASPLASSSASATSVILPLRAPRNPPYLRSHHRSRSSAATSATAAPLMTRAYSSPVVTTSGRILLSGGTMAGRPSSPSNAYRRYHSPSRRALDEAGRAGGVRETVWEEAEGETTTHDPELRATGPTLPVYQSHTFPRRHRPSSPLHQVVGPATFHPGRASSRAASPTPILARYNEAYPSHHGLVVSASSTSASSMPSTPTSTRSRSPSVSSLETIPDSPDAEEAALEAERIAQLKAAADAADGGETASGMARRRSYLDGSTSSVAGRGGGGFLSVGPWYGSREKRKRWSVCGGERRGDLDLETIWED